MYNLFRNNSLFISAIRKREASTNNKNRIPRTEYREPSTEYRVPNKTKKRASLSTNPLSKYPLGGKVNYLLTTIFVVRVP